MALADLSYSTGGTAGSLLRPGEGALFTSPPSEYHRMLEVSKIEVVCCTPDVECLVETLVKVAHTGFPRDGTVFVTPVEQAIKVRTGAKNSKALENSGGTT